MANKSSRKKQIESIQTETNSSSVINDVISNEFEQYPGQNEQVTEEDILLSSFEKDIVHHTVDGKTWNSISKKEQKP
ncbi:hypothetical protein [Bacillus sp. FJAT-45350]|uniref:hypothetical protein n=1 Tax=Bacillus sp. FJAT-45350 TaxID=2011014 RepID=UPI000BB68AFB|nr:hypothetical protein [Bacillus sp. FJAT-45350]